MQEKNFVTSFRRAKIIQLVIVMIFNLIVFLLFIVHPTFRTYLYSSMPLFILDLILWTLIIIQLLGLIYDFTKLRSFALESHALNQAAYLDHLTGIPNRNGLDAIFQTYDSPESIREMGCCMMTIENLLEVNARLGREAGDKLIRDFSHILEKAGKNIGTVARNGGNDFLCVIPAATDASMNAFSEQLENRIREYNQSHVEAPIRLKNAIVQNAELQAKTFPELFIAAYNKLHASV